MQIIYKGTTPMLVLTFDTDLDFTTADNIVVSFATDYHRTIFEKNKRDFQVTSNTITIPFTQQETLALKVSRMLIQMNALFGTSRVCSDVAVLSWADNLKNEVMV